MHLCEFSVLEKLSLQELDIQDTAVTIIISDGHDLNSFAMLAARLKSMISSSEHGQ